jgi:membrane dipeptidase
MLIASPRSVLDPAAAALHAEAIVVDCHDDLPVSFLTWHGRAMLEYDAIATWLPRLRAGGVNVQVQPLFIEHIEAEGALRRALLLTELLSRQAAAHADEITICTTGTRIRETVAAGRIAMVLALEGIAYLGDDIELLGTFQRLGVRMVSLTHLGRTVLADGSGVDSAGGRLTARGVEAVAELERLGILVDVSHLGAASLDHLLEVSTRPLVASHSSAWTVRQHHRNLTDERLRAIAATGGVVSVNMTPAHIGEGAVGIDTVVRHIAHIAEVAGIDHVGLGPDFVAEYFRFALASVPQVEIDGLDFKQGVVGLGGPEDLPYLTEALLAAGFSEAHVGQVLGANLLRLFDAVLG